ncbi:PREDICTED: RING-H2 finger protein ATL56-like [Nelumbo nucifera]|uniref:RING-H2 finger protein ATL56-like n=2 Tax=Nelumbo nucifera TaxID=4432 RepID=A0A1U8BM08_NELNU|nr:PREDICTED: RING-H2 finger protein ATL56-like [Nelumbo nucifera]DAD27591.1 TPA_asm: hypothetical protein HUJ06_029059 [Nelumbo nucifera]
MSSEREDDANIGLNRGRSIGGARYTSLPSSPPAGAPELLVSSPQPPPFSMRSRHASTKPNPVLLSFLLRVVVMAIVISLFFLFVGIATIFLIHLCVVGGAFHRRRRRQAYSRDSGEGEVEFGVGLSPEDLQKLPCCNYGGVVALASGSASGSNRDCAVCLERLREEEQFRVLPGCKHAFHVNCVDAWLVKVPSCPICRSGIELRSSLGSGDFRV